MLRLLIKQFISTKTNILALSALLIIGIVSIGLGNQFISNHRANIVQVAEQQEHHINTHVKHHPKDLGLALYYLKFMYVNTVKPISGISIGQRDLNTNIQSVGILALEGQKYDTELVNPVTQQVGNLDLSFVIIFLFPLVIIALCFNILSEEQERGIWKMLKIQSQSPTRFLVAKFGVRILFMVVLLLLLFLFAKIWLNIPLDAVFIAMIGISTLYILFWFSVAYFVMSLQKNSNINAISLLTIWLLLVVVCPMMLNNYATHQYPINDAFSLSIKQRDGYHKKWDTDKETTVKKFYQHYPQYKHYPIQEEGFSWLWYYAMQQMGDDESLEERTALYQQIYNRQSFIHTLANLCPPLQTQLAMNQLSQTGLSNYLGFLHATTDFHERLRLSFYDDIFSKQPATDVDWGQYKPEYYTAKTDLNLSYQIGSLCMFITLLSCLGFWKLRKL